MCVSFTHMSVSVYREDSVSERKTLCKKDLKWKVTRCTLEKQKKPGIMGA